MSKFYSMLGIGRRAGFVHGGETPCLIQLKKRMCHLLIIAHDSSENTKEKFINICRRHNVRYVFYGNKESLGSAIGKGLISTIVISNKDFADSLLKLIS
jgi:ribosomal protein L7Ae-like RNA K-turn-binding protein